VSGIPVQQATQRLTNAGFTVQVSPRTVDSTRPQGTVAYTSPSANVVSQQGTSVIIFVSSGNGPVRPGKKHKHGGGVWPFN
jgi:beta-lactam-binding protein with PASTA domain